MKPIGFKQAVKVLQRPSAMHENECGQLPVWCDGTQCVSCWRPTFLERVRIILGGNVWLGVKSGKTQPPVFVSGQCVFAKTPANSKVKAAIVYMCECIMAMFDKIKKKACNENE